MNIEKSKKGTITTYKYIWSEDKLTHQSWDNKYMHFYYDYKDEIIGFTYYNGTTSADYTYVKNMQGDVIGIVNDDGTRIADYSYDVWGRLRLGAVGIGLYNPIRYRGYCYDDEISMYYLQSRYYDPAIGRFINSDDTNLIEWLSIFSITGGNLFGYCNNHPIMYIDPNGYKWYSSLDSYYKDFIKKAKKAKWKRAFLRDYNRYKSNHNKNLRYFGTYTNYIWGQAYKWDKIHVNIKDMLYNKAKIKDVGCELVAVYNVMKKLNKRQNFAQIILEFVLNGLSWNEGDWGTESAELGKYFDNHNVKYSHYYKDTSGFEKKAKKGKIAIISFWNSDWFWDGIHTVAIYYSGGKWKVYNYHSKDETIRTFNKLSDILKGKNFIRGYVF